MILGRRWPHNLLASPMSSALNQVTDTVCQARGFLDQIAQQADPLRPSASVSDSPDTMEINQAVVRSSGSGGSAVPVT